MRISRLFLVFACFLGAINFAQAQNPSTPKPTGISFQKASNKQYPHVNNTKEPCMYDQLLAKKMEDPAYREQMERFEAQIRKASARIEANRAAGLKADLLTIPIVFHVMHTGEAEGTSHNIPTDQIISSVTALNRDFRRLATDGGIAQGAGPDMEIEFCLATIDPDGNPTNGIVRVDASGVANYDNIGIDEDVNGFDIKALSKWPTKDYVNIWVVREINDQGEYGEWNGGTLGYAYPVSSSSLNNPNTNPTFNPGDGIVVANFSLGNDPDQSEGWNIYNNQKKNRTLTHEMGHHLNLQHTFKGGSCSEGDCATEGDFVCDTPPTPQNTSCNSPACSGTQQVANYMDYTGENCANMFSAGQKTRMRAVLEGISRSSLTSSVGCSAGFARADFEVDNTTPAISQNVNFTDLSTSSPAIVSWNWNMGDGTTYTTQNPTHAYTTGGFKTVTLTISNGTDSDTETKTDYIFISDQASGTIGGICDTLRNFTEAEAATFTVYQSGGDVVPGISGSSFEGFAETFQNSGTYVFQSFDIAVQRTNDMGAASDVIFNVYADAAGSPSTVLASGAVPLSALTENSYNRITFAEPIEVTGDFYIGWEFAPTTDTLAVYATQLRDNNFNSLRVKYQGNWVSFADTYFSMAISTIPYKDFDVAIDEINGFGEFCITESATFEVANDINIASYDWTLTNATPSSSNSASPTVSYDTEGTKTVNLTATGRCGGSKTDSYTLTAVGIPEVTSDVVDATCENANGSITLTPVGGANLTYNWIGQSNQTNVLEDVIAGTYDVEISNGTCNQTLSFTIESTTSTIPGSMYTENPTCEEENGLVAVVMSVAGNYEFFWNGSSSAQNDTLYNQAPGNFDVIVKEDGCTVATLQTTLQNVGNVPNVDFTYTPDPVVEDIATTFTSSFPSAGSHLWKFSNGTPSSSDINPEVTFDNQGTVDVTLVITSPNNCIDSITKTITIDNNVGIAEQTHTHFSIYPNPNNGIINIASKTANIAINSVEVVDVLGKKIPAQLQQSTGETQVQLNTTANGTYILSISTNQGVFNKRITVIQ